MGERSISPMGHVRMMAAAQPFLSGRDLQDGQHAGVRHRRGRRGDLPPGLEAGHQGARRLPSRTARSASRSPPSARSEKDEDREGRTSEPEKVVEYRPVRKRLPKGRPGITTSFTVGGAEGYMTANSYPDDGLGEVFLKMSKQGSTLAGMMDAFSIAVSVGLQYGVPLETYVSKFTNMRFEPAGMTDDPDVRMAQSIVDYIFRRLALDFLPFETRSALGIHSAEERQRHLETGSYEPSEEELDVEGLAQSAPRAETVKEAKQKAKDEANEQAKARGSASHRPRRPHRVRRTTPRS